MRGKKLLFALLGASGLMLATDLAGAQVRCPEGRTASGACVNPALAQGMRRQVIVFTQPKLSYAAKPVLPVQDRNYYIARDYHEMLYLFTMPQVSSVFVTRPFPGF
jgi:hypothetical protein